MQYPEPISKLMDSYMKLPGIGAKTAARLAFFTIDMREEDVTDFAKSLISAKEICIIVPIAARLLKMIPVKYAKINHVIEVPF